VPYTVSTPVFEGPFDLLLHLITREQVDLWEVSLADIVDRYVETLEQLRGSLDLEVATEFLLIAAVLLELKARRLLPGPDDVELDDELGLWEQRDLLLARLLECKTFKDASGSLEKLMQRASHSFPRTAGLEAPFLELAPDLLEGVRPIDLRDTMDSLLAPRPTARVLLDHVAPIRLSVGDAVTELSEELARLGRVTFARLSARCTSRLEVIVAFLALLELYKQGVVELEQNGNFAELHVEWLGRPDGAGEAVEGATDPLGVTVVEEYQG
jgi:segregation and condensation protein A